MKYSKQTLLIAILLIGSLSFLSFEATTATAASNFKLDATEDPFASDYYIVQDASDDAKYADKELDMMKIGANSTHLVVEIVGNITAGGTHLLLDLDPGEGTGFTDMTNAGWFRQYKFVDGFGAEYWAAGWEQNHGDLWNSTPEVIDDNGGNDVPGYTFLLDAVAETKKYHFSYDFMFPTAVPSFAEVGIAAVVVGGDGTNAMETIPSMAGVPGITDTALTELGGYLHVNITDTSTGALGETPEVGYFGFETSNLKDGNLTAGSDLEMVFNVWINELGSSTQTVNFHPNTSDIIDFYYTVERNDVNVTEDQMVVAYKEFGSTVGLGSDKHVASVDASEFQEGDKVFWKANVSQDFNFASDISYGTTSGVFYVAPLPALYVNFVSGQPTGGFIAPGDDVVITSQANFRNAENRTDATGFNDNPAANLPVEVTMYWRANDTGSFSAVNMTWQEFSNDNNGYKSNIGSFKGGNITYYVTAWVFDSNNDNETENVMSTNNATLLIGIEPEREMKFSIEDFTNDLSLDLPTEPTPPNGPWGQDGLIDILKFEVLSNEFNIEFRMTFSELTNDFDASSGFSVVIFSIYVDMASGGETSTLWNERVTTQTGWEYALKGDGFVEQVFSSSDTTNPLSGTGMIQTGDTETNQASLVIPVDVLGGQPEDDWKYYVMSGSDDFNAYRAAGPTAGEWALGGGEEGETDPNVIDMIVPDGGDEDLQDFLLGGYDQASNTLAEVLPIGVNEAFVADTENPTATVTVKLGSDTVSDGDTVEIEDGDTVTIDFTIEVSDGDTSVLSGLDKVEVFDGNILLQEFTDLSGLSDSLTLSADFEEGDHEITINVYDVSGNIGTVTFSFTVGLGGPAFIPLPLLPTIIAIVGLGVLSLRRRKH